MNIVNYKFNIFGAVNNGIFGKMDIEMHRNSSMLIGRSRTTLQRKWRTDLEKGKFTSKKVKDDKKTTF